MSRLYFAAKAPTVGGVKTRLGATIGMDAAATLYRAFLRDLVVRFTNVPFDVGWFVPPGSWRQLQPIIGRVGSVRIQRGATWAARQANLFRDCDAAGEGAVVLAATDSPHLKAATVEQAFTALKTNELVIGPTADGGYYLVGMRGFHDIFSGVAMSSASALDQLLARARSKDAAVRLLDTDFDVDTDADLSRLTLEIGARRDLDATVAALGALKVAELTA